MNYDKELVNILNIVNSSFKELDISEELFSVASKIIQSPISKKEKLKLITELAKKFSETDSSLYMMIIDYFSLFVLCNFNSDILSAKKRNPEDVAVYTHTSRLIKTVRSVMKKINNEGKE